MDEIDTGTDRDQTDPRRILFLGLWTTALAIVFTVLVIGESVSAMTF